jgi:hypothetical protein
LISNGLLYWGAGGVNRASLSGGNAVSLGWGGGGGGGGLAVADGKVFFTAILPALMSVPQ